MGRGSLAGYWAGLKVGVWSTGAFHVYCWLFWTRGELRSAAPNPWDHPGPHTLPFSQQMLLLPLHSILQIPVRVWSSPKWETRNGQKLCYFLLPSVNLIVTLIRLSGSS